MRSAATPVPDRWLLHDRIRLTGLLRKRPPRGPFLFAPTRPVQPTLLQLTIAVMAKCRIDLVQSDFVPRGSLAGFASGRSRVRSAPQNATIRRPPAHEQLRRPLHAHGRRPLLRDLPARRAAGEVRRRAAAVRAQGAAREPAAQRGRAGRDRDDIEALARWVPTDEPSREIAYTPARVLLQDFTGVPAVVDLAAMRDAMGDLGGDPARINPLQPAELVIDHSVQVDEFGTPQGVPDQRRPRVRAQQGALRVPALGPAGVRQLRVVPPDTGIVHQVNLEYLARVVFVARARTAPRRPTPTRSSAPTPTPRWSTASACSAGEWGGSRPRPRCWASRSRC